MGSEKIDEYLKLESIRKIEKHTKDLSFDNFVKDELIQDDVMRKGVI